MFVIQSRVNVLVLSFLLFILLEAKPRIAIYLLFCLVLYMGLLGSVFTEPVFLVDKLTYPGGVSSAAASLIRFELLPLVFIMHLVFQILAGKKVPGEFRVIPLLILLFLVICLFSFLINDGRLSELVYFIFKFILLLIIILDISLIRLKSSDLQFLFRFILFSVTFLQIFLITVGWIIPSIMGSNIYPDLWGGTEGTKSIYFLNLISVGTLFFVAKFMNSKLKSIPLSNWILFLYLIVLIILPYSFLLIVFFLLTVVLISYMINKSVLSKGIVLLSFLILVILTFSFLNNRFSMIRMMTSGTIERIYYLGTIGIKNNPKLITYQNIISQYLDHPAAIVFGMGPGVIISGTTLQSSYIGDRSIVTGGVETRNFPFYVTFVEAGFFGGILIYFSLFLIYKVFRQAYFRNNDKLAFYGIAILTYAFLVSLVQESFEYPSVALVEGLLLGLLYLNHKRYLEVENTVEK